MPRSHRLRLAALASLPLAALALAACSGGDPETTSTSGTTSSGAGGSAAFCSSDPRADAYVVGLSRASKDGTLKVRFVDANPAPPAKGTNTFVVAIEDEAGKPVDGATVTLTPFMPDHGHGSSVTPQVAPGKDPGTYQVSNVYLFMPGIWQLTFDVTPAGQTKRSVVFTFCVEG